MAKYSILFLCFFLCIQNIQVQVKNTLNLAHFSVYLTYSGSDKIYQILTLDRVAFMNGHFENIPIIQKCTPFHKKMGHNPVYTVFSLNSAFLLQVFSVFFLQFFSTVLHLLFLAFLPWVFFLSSSLFSGSSSRIFLPYSEVFFTAYN